ncbi:MAG TPA: glutathione S-transferase, partial [Solirubrobacterales bacterium]|nr:glutathione S-transferase [Solirubrobacterales bacterium]
LAKLPAMLDRVDAWIEAGVLNGEQLNAADFQIAPSIGLAMTLDDLRPAIEGRPASELARRLVPNYPGRMPPVIPADWLTALQPA